MRTRSRAVLAGILILGVSFAIANRKLPVVRNALVYAALTSHLRAHHMRFWQVCDAPQLAQDKACGFSVLAAPADALFGSNLSLKLASCLGTVLFVLTCYAFLRRFNPRFGLADDALPLELTVACANPLVFYQFWSAYPDSLFAAGFLACFVLLERILFEPDGNFGRLALIYGALLIVTIWVKHWGLLLFPLHAVYLYWHRES